MPYAYEDWNSQAPFAIHPAAAPFPDKDMMGCCGPDFEWPKGCPVCCALHLKCCPMPLCDCSTCPPGCFQLFCGKCCDGQCADCSACPPAICKAKCPPACCACPPAICTAKCPPFCCNGCPPECCKAKCGFCPEWCCKCPPVCCFPDWCPIVCPCLPCPWGVQGCEIGPVHGSFMYCCKPQEVACCHKEILLESFDLKKGDPFASKVAAGAPPTMERK